VANPVDIIFNAIKSDLTGRSGIGNEWEACAESYDGFEPEVKEAIQKALIETGLKPNVESQRTDDKLVDYDPFGNELLIIRAPDNRALADVLSDLWDIVNGIEEESDIKKMTWGSYVRE